MALIAGDDQAGVVHAERVGPRQEIEKKARANAVLIAEAGSGSELDRGLFPYN